jgi:hypothetical protein
VEVSACTRKSEKMEKVSDLFFMGKMNQYFKKPLMILRKYRLPPREVGVMGPHRSM